MSEEYSHVEWIAGLMKELESANASTLSPEWDSVDSYKASIVINAIMGFESRSRTEKNDIFAYLLGCLVRLNNTEKDDNE